MAAGYVFKIRVFLAIFALRIYAWAQTCTRALLESSVLGRKCFLCKWQSYELWTESIFVKFLCQGIFKNEKWWKMSKWVILTAWNLGLFVDFYKGNSQNQLYIPNIKSEDSEKCVIKFLKWHHLLGVHFHWKLSFFSTTTKTKQTCKFWSLETNFENFNTPWLHGANEQELFIPQITFLCDLTTKPYHQWKSIIYSFREVACYYSFPSILGYLPKC